MLVIHLGGPIPLNGLVMKANILLFLPGFALGLAVCAGVARHRVAAVSRLAGTIAGFLGSSSPEAACNSRGEATAGKPGILGISA